MDRNWQENRIRELFIELRKRDDARTPDFEAVWAAAAAHATRERHRYVMRLTVIAIMAAVLAIIFALVIIENRTQKTPPAFGARSVVATGKSSFDLPWKTCVLICEWRSPTDFLLQSPAGISQQVPSLTSPSENKYR